jgi:aerobic-type carbon monoxide dehydrogenase small subunit (CoxS/CutS family)
MATIELRVNGSTRQVDVDPDRTLLSVLRDELDLTGTKYGCGEGQCGACTVLLDGKPALSCQLAAGRAEGKQIATIEGLAKEGRLHPLQEAFVDLDAMQCGYCTPGLIMAGAALLAGNPDPSEAQIAEALEGHICRCGVYQRVIAAIRRAAEVLKGGAR